ncbi:MAG: diguanylate cyclase [bacterium]|nr:diguanylate cyclase [bacterium]
MKKGKIWKKFIINISLVIVLFLMGIFMGFVFRSNQVIKDQLLTTAKGHFNNIVLARRWNASYGGVFVKKVEGIVSNPYLENPDIQTKDGVVYTKKNPALMTREISEYAEKEGDFKYHITSLLPLNPNNIPDDFEKRALNQFEKGKKERYATIVENEDSTYRYMAPLYVEKGCLGCHGKQGYKIGDVRGGISVSFDITKISRQMAANRMIFLGLSVAISLFLLVIIFFLISRLSRKLSDAYRVIEKLSVTDELMQIYNRRYFRTRLDEEIQRTKRFKRHLSLLLIDIDHFKKVNDVHGHQAGDDVLVGVASILKNNVRKVDIIARYGGEEIVVILPETDKSGAYSAAEKIRKVIENHTFDISGGKKLSVTASFGVSSLEMIPDESDEKSKQIIKLADDALYKAKEEGRNRVVLFK